MGGGGGFRLGGGGAGAVAVRIWACEGLAGLAWLGPEFLVVGRLPIFRRTRRLAGPPELIRPSVINPSHPR